MGLKERFESENGGVLILVAIVLPLLLLVSAGGVGGFSLYASSRELQRAADQAALAAGAALPPADPNVLVDNAPFPLPSTDPVFDLVDGATGQNLPRIHDLIPDPRAVACAMGTDALSSADSATLTSAFSDVLNNPLTDDGGNTIQTVCSDPRVYPVIDENPDNTTPVECTNRLVQKVADAAGPLNIDQLGATVSQIQTLVNGIVKMPLDHVLPAAFTPRVTVTMYSKLHPPLISLITGHDSGTIKSTATAYRRFKNAVVVPILPAQQLQIALGTVTAIQVITDPVNLNNALHTTQKPLLDAITDADNRLDSLMATEGLPCQHLLHNLRQDLRDIYDPPTGPAPSALDIVDAAVSSTQATADRVGASMPDPTNPDSLAGEGFLLIGVAVNNLMQPVAATQIPILDAALVTMSKAATGDYRATLISAANAYGVFRATLVK